LYPNQSTEDMRTKKRFVSPVLIPVGILLIGYAIFIFLTYVNLEKMETDSIKNLIFLSIMAYFGIFFIFATGVIELKLEVNKITKYINLLGLKMFRIHTDLPKKCKGLVVKKRKAFWHSFMKKENFFFLSSYDVAIVSMREREFNILNLPKEDALKYAQELANFYNVEWNLVE